jgi:hypothetical protein
MKGSHLFWLSRSKGMTADIWIGDYNPPRCFQKKISGRSKHNALGWKEMTESWPLLNDLTICLENTQGELSDGTFILVTHNPQIVGVGVTTTRPFYIIFQ